MKIYNHPAKPLGLRRDVLFIGFLMVSWLLMPSPARSAPFNSGSTGADGAFSPTTNTVLTVPPSGTFHFTTIDIPAGVSVTFTPNATNTPVTMLTSGDVTIAGTISLNGINGADGGSPDVGSVATGGAGGPGGFTGGAGGLAPAWNGGNLTFYGQGLGPGSNGNLVNTTNSSGCPANYGTFAGGSSNCNGPVYGSATLLPLIGGSGGSGGYPSSSNAISCTNGCNGGGGGGGGGAILIASSGTITLSGSITAIGGNGGNGFNAGGPGSGGGVRLIANTIAGAGSVSASGGGPNRLGWYGGGGRIRLEANAFSFTGTATPTVTVATPGLVNFSPAPALSITAIAGVSVPSSPTASFSSPDITLPSSITSPVTINLSASNIPVGTVISVTRTGRNSTKVVYNSTPLSGTDASSTATASVGLSTYEINVIRAETTFAVQTASNDFPTFAEGEKVEKVRVASALGGPSEVFLITESGKEVRWR